MSSGNASDSLSFPYLRSEKKKQKPTLHPTRSEKIKGGKPSCPDIRHVTCIQWEAWKQKSIRADIITMSRRDTAIARNSFLHNMSIGLLTAGFHKSFEEIINLVEHRKNERLKAGKDSVLWEKPTLEVETDKLNMLRQELTKAEAATRTGNWEGVYAARHRLADYFLQCEDFRLSDYFFKSSLEISFKIRLDGRKREAEALFHMGLVCERNGDIEGAGRYMDECYQLSIGRAWTDSGGQTLCLTACLHLSRLNNTLAEQCCDPEEAFPLLKKSLEAAKESENLLEMAQAALKLGMCYNEMKDHRSAMQYLSESFKTAQAIQAEALLGQACEALAQSHYQQGDFEKCLEYLRLYTDAYHSHDDRQEYIKACTCLGTIYNLTGDYELATDKFCSAYIESNAINRKDETSQVLLGVAKGNLILPPFMRNLEVKEEAIMMSRIVAWKDELAEQFHDPLPIHLSSLSMPASDAISRQQTPEEESNSRPSPPHL